MFTIVPLIIIFLSSTYIYMNDSLSLFTTLLLYGVMVITILTSFILYKKVNNDLKLQDLNSIFLEIDRLEKLIKTTKDIKKRDGLIHKIKKLKKERERKIDV